MQKQLGERWDCSLQWQKLVPSQQSEPSGSFPNCVQQQTEFRAHPNTLIFLNPAGSRCSRGLEPEWELKKLSGERSPPPLRFC